MRSIPLLSLLFLFGVADGFSPQEAAKDSPYYPLKVGNQWTYRTGDKKVLLKVIKHEKIEVTKGEKIDKVVCAVLEASVDDKVVGSEHVAAGKDGLYRFQALKDKIVPPVCFLKPNKGENW